MCLAVCLIPIETAENQLDVQDMGIVVKLACEFGFSVLRVFSHQCVKPRTMVHLDGVAEFVEHNGFG